MSLDRRGFLQHSGLALGLVSLQASPGHAARNDRAANTTEITLKSPSPTRWCNARGSTPARLMTMPRGAHGGGGPMSIWHGPSASMRLPGGRVIAADGAFGASTDWIDLESTIDGGVWKSRLRVEAGGWYRLELRGVFAQRTVAAGAVEPFGVGEVFVVAGQSYAEGANDELLKVTEPAGRVTALDFETAAWQIAHDPQPRAGTGGPSGLRWAICWFRCCRSPWGL